VKSSPEKGLHPWFNITEPVFDHRPADGAYGAKIKKL
jgi:hypothetical protein